jgi:hypothetical protein
MTRITFISNMNRTTEQMVAWDKTKGKQGNSKNDIERLVLGFGETRVRLIGEVLPRYVYWIVDKEGKRRPVECLRFDRKTETFTKEDDPMMEVDEAIYSDKPQFAYVCNVIDRKDKKIKLFDLRSTIYQQIVDYAANPEYGNPADPDNGYDITIKKEKTGPLPQNVKYTCVPARGNVPLTEDERAMELYDLEAIVKRMTYMEQKEWLLKNTSYFDGMGGDEFTATEDMDDLA